MKRKWKKKTNNKMCFLHSYVSSFKLRLNNKLKRKQLIWINLGRDTVFTTKYSLHSEPKKRQRAYLCYAKIKFPHSSFLLSFWTNNLNLHNSSHFGSKSCVSISKMPKEWNIYADHLTERRVTRPTLDTCVSYININITNDSNWIVFIVSVVSFFYQPMQTAHIFATRKCFTKYD